MEKKIIALGPKSRKSFMITLPIDWVKAQGLHQSRKANLEIVGNSAVIRPCTKEASRVVIDMQEVPHAFLRIVSILYKKGIGEIKVINATPAIINQLSQAIEQRCIGFEIIDQGKGYCVIKDVARESVEDFHTLLRRAFLIVLQLSGETDKESLKNLDKSLNKITAYCQRLLAREGYAEFYKVCDYSKLCSELEHIGDEYIRAYAAGEKTGKSCNQLLRGVYDVFARFSQKNFDAVQQTASKTKEKAYYGRAITRRLNTALGIIYALKA